MSESGQTWRRPFKALPEEARAVRRWAACRVAHPDVQLVANELFVAVLGAHPDVVEMTLSTAGSRVRVTATGPAPLPVRHSHGPGARIVTGLSALYGVTADTCGLWAQLAKDCS